MAPLLGELISGHQPPLEFFNPIALVVFSLPYGCGALLCREMVVRWKLGWPGLLLLGLAYGIYEEAIVVRSLFNPRWDELGPLATYGFVGGVNWTWSIMVLHFHVAISIFASVVLVELLYPARRRDSWVGGGKLTFVAIYLLLWTPLGWLMTDYLPPTPHYLVSILAVPALAALARRGPEPPSLAATSTGKPAPPWWFFAIGCFNTLAIFLGVALSAEHAWPALRLTMLVLGAVEIGTLWLVRRLARRDGGLNDRQQLALVAGLLAFFIAFSALKDVEEGFAGYSVVSFLATWGLWRAWRLVKQRQVGPSPRFGPVPPGH
jgi:hypothetical protein